MMSFDRLNKTSPDGSFSIFSYFLYIDQLDGHSLCLCWREETLNQETSLKNMQATKINYKTLSRLLMEPTRFQANRDIGN